MKLVNYFISIIFVIGLPIHLKASNSITIYVWDFTSRDGIKDDLTSSLTEEFEEALIKTGCFKVLQRRNYSRIFSQRQNEKGIMNLEKVPKTAIDNLKALQANTVAFGEVYDDLQSGQTRVSVTLESFEGAILKKESILFPRFVRIDPIRRQEKMRELAEKLPCAKPQTTQDSPGPIPPRPTPTTVPQKLPVYKAVGSSAKSEKFVAQKVLDGKTSTSSFLYSWWPREGDTKGAWIELYLNQPCLVTDINYFLAFPKYGGGSQIRQATLAFNTAPAQKVLFNYESGWQKVSIKPVKTERLKLIVDDIFPVGNGSQLQVIELELYGHSCDKT